MYAVTSQKTDLIKKELPNADGSKKYNVSITKAALVFTKDGEGMKNLKDVDTVLANSKDKFFGYQMVGCFLQNNGDARYLVLDKLEAFGDRKGLKYLPQEATSPSAGAFEYVGNLQDFSSPLTKYLIDEKIIDISQQNNTDYVGTDFKYSLMDSQTVNNTLNITKEWKTATDGEVIGDSSFKVSVTDKYFLDQVQNSVRTIPSIGQPLIGYLGSGTSSVNQIWVYVPTIFNGDGTVAKLKGAEK